MNFMMSSCSSFSKHLAKEQLIFCEDFFISLQIKKNKKNQMFDIGMSDEWFAKMRRLFSRVRAKGYDDVLNAFYVPDSYSYEERNAFQESTLKDLGLDSDDYEYASLFGDIYFYAKIAKPELKESFVEKLENGSEVWLIRDYQSMTQARLLIKANGDASIGDVQKITDI